MKNNMVRKGIVLGIIVLFVGASVVPSTGTVMMKTSTKSTIPRGILYVGGSGPGNYSKIQDAIDNASDWDTIYVYNGIYPEHIIINKNLEIKGENKYETYIDGLGSGSVVRLEASNCLIHGFTITNCSTGSSYGLLILSENITITDNIISFTYIGLLTGVGNTDNNIIENNIFFDNILDISISHSSHNTITTNTLQRGIYMYNGTNNTISNNTLIRIGMSVSSYNQIVGNNFSSSYFFNNERIDISNSNNNSICDNIINNSKVGISLIDSNTNIILNNKITYNSKAIILGNSSFNIIENNNITNSNFTGIEITDSTYNIIFKNHILNNDYGMSIGYSTRNNVFNNTIIGNFIGMSFWGSTTNYIHKNYYLNNSGSLIMYERSDDNTVELNTITLSKVGIQIDNSNENLVILNNISYNLIGIQFTREATNNDIEKNNIERNSNLGIDVFHSPSNVFLNNNIIYNSQGISLNWSSNNQLLENNLIKHNFTDRLATFFESYNTTWKNNYWNRPRILPKIIIGFKATPLYLCIDIDFRPALQPNDITSFAI
ncbi:MAG: right-handed parallel beta-helix repeat-containing protein [Thermoplasmatales archaeon]|nr:right-handed parallel beta-helix repeat-containing protein [Thermoplasmatales archaeon]